MIVSNFACKYYDQCLRAKSGSAGSRSQCIGCDNCFRCSCCVLQRNHTFDFCSGCLSCVKDV